MADDGFLSRWGRRKAEARKGVPAREAATAPPAPEGRREAPLLAASAPTAPAGPTASTATASIASTATEVSGSTAAAAATPSAAPLPTLADVARLTKDSDFSPFVARNVDADVRNAAMKKLFSDPHFNVMDGLDTYIDDYGKPNPIPLSMLRRMNQSVTLGLFTEEADAAAEAPLPALPAVASPDGAGPAAVAQSESPVPLPAAPEHRADDDPGLQLQRDDADRRPGAGPGPRD